MSQLASAAELNPATLPLHGRHLIEASAGTGKTYNITRLYLRLLLEKQLPVQQILVMTFTKAATEELRGRIDKELRNALANWGKLGAKDPFFAQMEGRFSQQQAAQYLQPALLELDEAAIFTIHGFCNRALRQQAFASGMPLEVEMEADTSELLLEAVRDWIRLVNQQPQSFALLEEKGWHLPEAFLAKFQSAMLSHGELISSADPELLAQQSQQYKLSQASVTEQRRKLCQLAAEQHQLVIGGLANSKQSLADNWPDLITWLQQEELSPCPANVSKFKSRTNYSAAGKRDCVEFIDALATLITQIKSLLQDAEELRQGQRLNLARQGVLKVQQKFAWVKQQLAMLDFDDLISSLSSAVIADPQGTLVQSLRKQYPVALVDEFQDTDPQQYGILDCLYPKAAPQTNKHHALLMIGDPKQAIYAFRGGDIFTYLEAREGADYQWIMHTNYRSTGHMVTAYNRLFWGAALSDAKQAVFGFDIQYEQILSTDKAAAASLPLHDPQSQLKALNYLWLPEVAEPSGKKGTTSDDYFKALARASVAEIQRLLLQAKLGNSAIRQQDIAILVRRGYEAELMQQTLSSIGLSSVYLSARDNVFASVEAHELILVLTGVLESEREEPIIAALSTRLMGGNAQKLASYRQPANESDWETVRQWLLSLRQSWQQQGCMAMLLQLIHHHFIPSPKRHERALTNMLHLAELLQQAARQHNQPQQLLKWLQHQCQQLSAQAQSQLRLESDENLIRIVTQHGSKGLEYPIVFVPFSCYYKDPARFGRSFVDYYEYHDADRQLVKQIGQSEQAIQAVTQEGHAESIRLLYVAVTRATHRCYLGVAPMEKSHLSPLGLTLKLTEVEHWQQALTELVSSEPQGSALLQLEDARLEKAALVDTQQQALTDPQAATFAGKVEDGWSLSSFSGLVRKAQHQRQDIKERSDAVDRAFVAPASDSVTLASPALDPEALRFSLRKGADAGNLLHDTLEHTDFSQPDWQHSLTGPVARFGGLSDEQQLELADWLQDCLRSPLPNLHGEDAFCLADLDRSQTLRESEFYFPLDKVALPVIAQCLQQHRQTSAEVLLPGKEALSGMMHGFIDLIFEYQGRYYLADYKSTHLGNSLNHYNYAALEANNQAHFYDLQYLIYSVALHRFLQLRLPDYQAEQHLGGIYYLYLRGMSEQTQVHAESSFPGVFYSKIDSDLLLALDRVFSSASPSQGVA